MSPSSLPPNVHVSTHPCLLAKLSQLRSASAREKEVKALVHEISLIVGMEALAGGVTTVSGPQDRTPLGFDYTSTDIVPKSMSLVPILRSGLGMVEALQTILPHPAPVHHLGLYREPSTLEPVEYYNNLSQHQPAPATTGSTTGTTASSLAIILDPVIATGGTCAAAIQTLREWGAEKILVLSIIGAVEGIRRAAGEWAECTEIWVAGVDQELTGTGMLKPGLGDVGDRLFLTIGK